VILDVGANVDVRPEHLQQFSIMGSIYSRHVMDVPNPTVGLLSNGEEAGKGNQLVLSTYDLLANTPDINFHGNVESKDVMEGRVDVVVTDGFSGNIFLKTAEATARLLQQVMLEELTAGPISSVGAFLAQAALRRIRRRIDDSEYGGAVLLGLAGIVVVAHGRSKSDTIRHAIRVAKQGIEQNILERMQVGVANTAAIDSQHVDEGTVKTMPT
jgi:glycerol-3-phosphate acyltransferase PlsX